jgi:hypothetical protein
MEDELHAVARLLAEKRWPFRLHATYDETIGRALSVFERVASRAADGSCPPIFWKLKGVGGPISALRFGIRCECTDVHSHSH